jgi:4-hydroxyacetophenone monooxygenase
MSWLLKAVPGYPRWFRFWQFWLATEGRLPLVTVDPTWDSAAHNGTVSESNYRLQQQLVARLQAQFDGREDLLASVIPDYPPGGKRMLRDDGAWARALMAENSELVTTSIVEITAAGIKTSDGRVHEVDVIIYATGFKASDFLTPMEIVGKGGQDLHAFWDGDARAYKGTSVPGFPGLYMTFGPNTNLVVTGSAIFMSECSVEYIMNCLKETLDGGGFPLDVRKSAYLEYSDAVDNENALRAWGVAGVHSWYKNATGRVTQNWPFSLHKFYEQSQVINPEAYSIVKPIPKD